MNVIGGRRQHAEAGRADGAGGGALSRRGVLGGLAALFDNATKVILNQDFTSGLTQPAKLLDYFPYLAPPPES